MMLKKPGKDVIHWSSSSRL